MVATTGLQRPGFKEPGVKQGLITQFKDLLKSGEKFAEYTRKSLRGAKDIFDKGGHVTTVMKDQIFRLYYDNRRRIIDNRESTNSVDLSNVLLDSEPLKGIDQCKTLRFLAKFPTTKPFNKNNANKALTGYKSGLEIGVRNFIKAYYSKNETFGLKGTEFKYVKDLINFINGSMSTKLKKDKIKISISSVSHLKRRKLFHRPVPKTDENIRFAAYIKLRFPHFNEELFLTK
jgi:hypothetical protein